MQYYKVVTKDLKSIWTSQIYIMTPEDRKLREQFCIQYKLNEWTYPNIPGSKIFVFDDYETAKYFTQMKRGYVYKCDIINPIKRAPFFDRIKTYPRQALRMWKAYRNKKGYLKIANSCNNENTPYLNTVWCDAVKLTELVS